MEGVVFTPVLGDLYLTLGVCAVVVIVMIYLSVVASRSADPDPRKRVLMPMLAYFGALLGVMAFLGAFWSTFKYPEVRISERTLSIGDVEYPLPNVANMRLEAVGRGVNRDETVLLVQTNDRKNWAFPGDRYEVRRMYAMLRGGKAE